MKKILFLALALIICFAMLSACDKNQPADNGGNDNSGENAGENSGDTAAPQSPVDALVGSWTYESGGYTYHFNSDGTGTYDVGTTEMKFTFTATDTVLSITYEGNTEPMELEYEISGTTLNVKDSLGNDTIYKKN